MLSTDLSCAYIIFAVKGRPFILVGGGDSLWSLFRAPIFVRNVSHLSLACTFHAYLKWFCFFDHDDPKRLIWNYFTQPFSIKPTCIILTLSARCISESFCNFLRREATDLSRCSLWRANSFCMSASTLAVSVWKNVTQNRY